jgi:hypothetical protein
MLYKEIVVRLVFNEWTQLISFLVQFSTQIFYNYFIFWKYEQYDRREMPGDNINP